MDNTASLHVPADDMQFLSRTFCDNIFDRIFSYTTDPKYHVIAQIRSSWEGNIRWARNRTTLASNRRRIVVRVRVEGAEISTNQLDDASLKAAVAAAERKRDMGGGIHIIQDFSVNPPEFTPPEVKIWSDATYNTTNEMRAEIARVLTEEAERKDLLAAGFIKMRAGQIATKFRIHSGLMRDRYDQYTNAQCSTTVRHPQGTGSGWAGRSSYNWAAINGPELASRALDKCVKSMNPVRIEPGRYTVILEPQAVFQLVKWMFDVDIIHRDQAESREIPNPYKLGFDASIGLTRSKLGLKIVDERVTIRHNPSDPEMGVIPIAHTVSQNHGDSFWPILPVTWIERGVLKALNYGRDYALGRLNEDLPILWRPAWYMEGGDSSIEEMISTTKRGILVTRFSHVSLIDLESVLCTGITRDGLWLIENGVITKAVHNFRFTESPIFVLNQLELLGKPMPVYTENDLPAPAFAPPIKAHDFSFTSLVDAV
jgi:predicted Zn-dependent protease